jgi:hypothetical protein
MIKLAVVALPENNTLRELNSLRKLLYTTGFRYTSKLSNYDAHVTLAEGFCIDRDYDSVKIELLNLVKRLLPISTPYLRVTNECRSPVPGKCEYESAWVSVVFDSRDLKKLSQTLDKSLLKRGLSSTAEYISRVNQEALHSNSKIVNVTANNMNVCNLCRPEKAEEARNLVIQKLPKNIVFDKVDFLLI